MATFIPCPRCGDDRWYKAGAVRKPLPCGHCGAWSMVAKDGDRWVAVMGKPGRPPGMRRTNAEVRGR